MPFLRRRRRDVRPLGTMEGNPSVLDDVLQEGPPPDPLTGLPNRALWNAEKEEAVHSDLAQDLGTEMDEEAADEDRVFDVLGHGRIDSAEGEDTHS